MSVLESVSERRAENLAKFGVDSVLDLLTTYPRRYIDRTRQADVSDLVVGDEAAVLATVQSARSRRSKQGRAVVDVVVRDDTGRLAVVFFNQPWRAKQLEQGTEAIFFGKVGEYRGTRQMVNPVVDVVAGMSPGRRTLRILPVYPASAKSNLTSWEISTFVEEALSRAGELVDPLPAEWQAELELWGRTAAFGAIHVPESLDVVAPARRRLVFDELFRLQLALVLRRRAFEVNARALHHDVSPREITGAVSGTLVARFLSGLPYQLTTAQRQALAVIVADMAGPFPMHRLLQGDVGSGKTVVAVAALLAAVQSGHQGALMVPTEVLAEQHFSAVRALLGDLEGPGGMAGGDVRVELLTSKVKGRARTTVLEGLRYGGVGLVVGTHALLTEEVTFRSLGCVVIDEQHRFGVEQRATLRSKGVGRRPRPPRHDGDAHPAHRGHGHLRRPRPHDTRRAAARTYPGPHDLAARRPPEHRRRRPGTGCARRWRRATGPSSSARSSRARSVSRRSRPPRSSSGWPPASWPASRSA